MSFFSIEFYSCLTAPYLDWTYGLFGEILPGKVEFLEYFFTGIHYKSIYKFKKQTQRMFIILADFRKFLCSYVVLQCKKAFNLVSVYLKGCKVLLGKNDWASRLFYRVSRSQGIAFCSI